MILQELSKLYDRLVNDPHRGEAIPKQGFSTQSISFAVKLTPQGKLVSFDSMLIPVQKGKKTNMVTRKGMVLGGAKPSGSGLNPCFLWDNPAYLLGYKGSGDEKVETRAKEAFAALRCKHLSVEQAINHPHYSAVCRFLETWNPEQAPELFTNADLLAGNGIFIIQGEESYVHELPKIRHWWMKEGQKQWLGADVKKSDKSKEMCLITGDMDMIAALHEPAIKGVTNASPMGAKLVSFNCSSFTSYGKEQSFNAPVGERAAFAYCNALNYLLSRRESRLLIGDSTIVFWAGVPAAQMEEMESMFSFALLPMDDFESQKDAMDEAIFKRVGHVLKKIKEGDLTRETLENANARFFILGLSPNVSRLSIRYWEESTFGGFMESLQKHYQDMKLQRRWTEANSKKPDPEMISPYLLLRETARETKDVSPLLSGFLMKSILTGSPYPEAMVQAIIRRIKIDKNINYVRCSFLKAWLLRNPSIKNKHVITPMISEDNKEPGYLIGRIFAVYERAQYKANNDRELNKTIKDSFYGSVSSTPRGVLGRVNALHQHHLAKMEVNQRTYFNILLQKIFDKLEEVPTYLNLEQQSYFALGYYHQMQSFFTPKSEK